MLVDIQALDETGVKAVNFYSIFQKLAFKNERAACLINFPVIHVFSTVSAGNMSYRWGSKEEVDYNRKGLYESLPELNGKQTILMSPEHSNVIVYVNQKYSGLSISCDGLMTSDRNVILALYSADCFPLIFTTIDKKFVALVHASWASLNLNIIRKAIERIASISIFEVNPKEIYVAIGPGIRACCYNPQKRIEELKKEEKWKKHFICSKEELHLDLCGYILAQLLDGGVEFGHITIASACTVCTKDEKANTPLFYSHRRSNLAKEKESRLATLVVL